MLVSDLLVTDYSSAIYEFSLLGRPISFFAPDLEAYERERGFYLDFGSACPDRSSRRPPPSPDTSAPARSTPIASPGSARHRSTSPMAGRPTRFVDESCCLQSSVAHDVRSS